jgi:hypothetical protein
MVMRYHFGLGVGHTYAYKSELELASTSLDHSTTEGPQDMVEEDLDTENMDQSGPENDAIIDGSDLERSVDGESTDSDGNSDNLGDGNESDRDDVESEDEEYLEREEMYA